MITLPKETDERRGLPSASSMPRIHGKDGCLGSFLLESHLTEKGNRTAATRGDKIHAALEGKTPIANLPHSDRICAERMAYQEAELVEELEFEGATQFKEQRFWVHENGKKLFSAKPDVVHVSSDRLLAVNFKSGHYPVHPIEVNNQMICEGVAAAAAGNFLFKEIAIALIHPNCPLENGKIRQHRIIPIEQIKIHLMELIKTSKEAIMPGAPFNPSEENCRWCKGRKSKACHAYAEWSCKPNKIG
jgi:hypothetical protein